MAEVPSELLAATIQAEAAIRAAWIQAGAAVIGTVVVVLGGLAGVRAWKKEIPGTRRIRLIEECLVLGQTLAADIGRYRLTGMYSPALYLTKRDPSFLHEIEEERADLFQAERRKEREISETLGRFADTARTLSLFSNYDLEEIYQEFFELFQQHMDLCVAAWCERNDEPTSAATKQLAELIELQQSGSPLGVSERAKPSEVFAKLNRLVGKELRQ